MKRPNIEDAWQSFQEVYADIGKSVSAVGTKIGGKVDYNINKVPQGQGRFENACAIRMSYVLNENGINIPYLSGQTVSGAQGRWYIYKVKTLIAYLTKIFGTPEHIFGNPDEISFTDKQGILVFEVNQWSDASGHATIWNGNACSDKCYFPISKKAFLWELKSKHSSF
ncbi:hypothetical protein Mag101_03875 [Microbulbifer agarilyticus]|uniref:Cytoplasmic protein n=1 Tax=Microbulbifer agarilyticus TaxID=260552 RepID=A0A1Q2M3S6_9GAMM|nr:type VI secretion system amidase effector protein Tae4 [Microbulbifer agarilyticus]AQQ66872.1 hypothetical protein Mag101_03875 [Microbulbifer agarilyticus]